MVPGFQYMIIQFHDAPRKISRVIIRTVDYEVERLKKISLVVHAGIERATIPIDLDNQPLNNVCAVLVQLDYTGTPIANAADKLELTGASWYGYDTQGFKMDVFTMNPDLVSTSTAALSTSTSTTKKSTTSTTTISTTRTTTKVVTTTLPPTTTSADSTTACTCNCACGDEATMRTPLVCPTMSNGK